MVKPVECRGTVTRGFEGLATGALGAGLAWIALSTLEGFTGGLATAGALVAGMNGLISGVTGVYAWRRVQGWLCFVLDSTWGLTGVAGGVLLHAVNAVYRAPGYVVEMSRRSNRHVYESGFSPRPGFALALGNVVSGGGGGAGLRGDSPRAERRRRLVEVHEGTHVFQNRLFGPLLPLGYLGWMVLAGAAGLLVWLIVERKHLWPILETFCYYDNPFEYWAYRKDDYWPPRGAHPRYVWVARRYRRPER